MSDNSNQPAHPVARFIAYFCFWLCIGTALWGSWTGYENDDLSPIVVLNTMGVLWAWVFSRVINQVTGR